MQWQRRLKWVLFAGQYSGLTNKAKQAAYGEQGGAGTTVVHIKDK